MREKRIVRLIVLVVSMSLLVSCTKAIDIEAPEASPITSTSALTVAPTNEVVEPGPAPLNLDQLSTKEIALLLFAGEISYPVEFNNQRRAELAVAIANEVNHSIVPQQVYVDTAQGRVVWDAELKAWRAYPEADDADVSAEKLPPLIVAGYTDLQGQAVYVDSTGQEVVVPKTNLPGLGQTSIESLFTMDRKELSDYTIDLLESASASTDDPGGGALGILVDYFSPRLDNGSYFVLPVIIYKNSLQTDFFYSDFNRDAPAQLTKLQTNSVLFPVLIRIHSRY